MGTSRRSIHHLVVLLTVAWLAVAVAPPSVRADEHRQVGAGYSVRMVALEGTRLTGTAPEVFYRQRFGARWVTGVQFFQLHAVADTGPSDVSAVRYRRNGYLTTLGYPVAVGRWTLLPQAMLGAANDEFSVKPEAVTNASRVTYNANTLLVGAAATLHRPVWRRVFAGVKLAWLLARSSVTQASGSTTEQPEVAEDAGDAFRDQQSLGLVLDVGLRF